MPVAALEARRRLSGAKHAPAGQTVEERSPADGPAGGDFTVLAAPHVDGCSVEGCADQVGIGHAPGPRSKRRSPDARPRWRSRSGNLRRLSEQGVEARRRIHHITDADRLEHRNQILVDVGEGQVGDDLVLRSGRDSPPIRPAWSTRMEAWESMAPLAAPWSGGVDDHRRILRLHGVRRS